MSLETGSLLNGRYRIDRILGQGGMGAVYLATDESLGIPCAVKENLNLSPESERLFRREATLLASMRHPNLPRVTNHFVLGDEQYLVMDFVEGEDLKERLARAGTLSEADVLLWATQICDALTYLHSLNPPIIHRDIKPANIKLTSSGEAMLVDFGIAKASDPSQKTATAAVALTPGFAPPEQYGLGRTAPATDQYALAATLYTLLTSHTPPDSMERLLGNTELVDPRQLRPDLSPHVAAALTRALEVKIENRFPSVAAFKAALLGETTPNQATQLVGPANTVPAGSAAPTILQRSASASTIPTTPGTTQGATQGVQPARKPLPIGWLIAAGGGGVIVLLGILLIGFAALNGLNTSKPTQTPGTTQTPTKESTTSGEATTSALLTQAVGSMTETPTVAAAPTDTPTPEPTATPTVAGTPFGGGSRIAFISNRDGQNYQIYTMNSDGSDVQQLTFDPTNKWEPGWDLHGTQLAWNPDGTKLVYVAAGNVNNGLDLWMIDANGKNQVDITTAPGNDYDPTWCGDGTLWFTSTRIGNARQIFYTTLADVAAEKRPNNFSATHKSPTEYDPALFPDCKSLIFITTSFDGQEFRRYFLDGSSNRTFRSSKDFFNAFLDDPAISPDGQYVLYTLRGSTNINLTESENRLSRIELTTVGTNFSAQWSPDGKWIVFTSLRDQNREIYLMTVAGTGQTNLTHNEATDTDPVWQPTPPAAP
jgi:serine/threonine protein kinase/Tol biopolymer transport system component